MRKFLLGISALLLLNVLPAFAQQDAQFSQYMFNAQYLNPATVGAEGVVRFQLLNRVQWAGYQATFDDGGSPITQVFSFNMPLNQISSGIGFHLVNDKIGPLTNFELQLSYAYRLKLSPDATLSLGVRGGLNTKTLNADMFRPREVGDVIIPAGGRINESQPDFAIGAYYQTSAYYLGISLNHVNNSKYKFGQDKATNPLKQTLYLTGGFNYYLNDLIELRPSALLKTDLNQLSLEANVLAVYNNKFWVGAGGRLGDGVIGMAGVYLMPNNALRLGAAVDLITNGASAKSPYSHEILLSYAIPAPQITKRTPVRTPRFRY
ncbi:MAG: type IX secretion system membrane protein PorP/SprF [Spirosomataceae bacterium]